MIPLFERLTFDQLLRLSEPKRVVRAGTVRVPPGKLDAFADSNAYYFNVKSQPSTTGLRHKCYIRVFKPANPVTPLEKCECLCDCDCADLRYRFAWANKQRGSGAVGPASLNQAQNRAPRITNPSARPGLCVAEGELVSTARGLIPIEDVVVGDMVWTLKGWKRVTASACTGFKQVVTIKGRTGRVMRLTPEHQVYVLDNDGFSWVQACDLHDGHRLCVTMGDAVTDYHTARIEGNTALGDNCRYTTQTITIDETVAELIGYMSAEGALDQFCNTDQRLIDDFLQKWRKVFGYESARPKSVDNVLIGRHGTRVLESMGFKFGSYNKVLPGWTLTSPRTVVVAFLRGAYAGDGNFCGRLSTYASVSEPLARGIHTLLTAIGVTSTIELYNSGINDSLTWLVRTSSSEETKKLFSILNPIRGYSTPPEDGGSCGIHEHVIASPSQLFSSAIKRSLERCEDTTGAKVAETILGLGFGPGAVDAAFRWLNERGKLKKARFPGSRGKPHNVAALSDIHDAVVNDKVARCMKKLRAAADYPKSNGTARNRFALGNAISALREIAPRAYDELRTIVDTAVTFDAVESVSPVSQSVVRVYDLTVDGAEHFTVNGIVVHNCKHLLALRDWLYGNITQFPGSSTTSKLDSLVKQSAKRWANMPAEIDKAKSRDRAMQQAWANIRAGKPAQPGTPIAPAGADVLPAPPAQQQPGGGMLGASPRRPAVPASRPVESVPVVIGVTPLPAYIIEAAAEVEVLPDAAKAAGGDDKLLALVGEIRDLVTKLVAKEGVDDDEPGIPANAKEVAPTTLVKSPVEGVKTESLPDVTEDRDDDDGEDDSDKDGAEEDADGLHSAQREIEDGDCGCITSNGMKLSVYFCNQDLGRFTDEEEALKAINAEADRQKYWPNIYSINDHGNISHIGPDGKVINSWV